MILTYLRVQLWLLWRSPRLLGPLLITPCYSFVFFAVLAEQHRPHLATSAAITAALMSTWSQAIFVASDAVDYDRWEGTLEIALLTPRQYAGALAVRVFTTTAISLPVLGEILLIGRLGFGFPVEIHHPVLLGAVLGLVLVGSAGIALAISGLLIIVRAARTMQNSMTYPFYVLGGLVLPVAALPVPLDWVGHLFYLSWGAQLLRDAAAQPDPAGVPVRLLILGLLVAASGLLGYAVLRRVLSRVRSGTVHLHG